MAFKLDRDSLGLIFKQIKNNMVAKEEGKGLSTNDYTTAEKEKLAGIAASAQVNVQSDWNANSGDAQILNKPTIPSKTSELTNDSGFLTTADIPEGAAASTTVPKMDGTAATGSEMAFARGDHVHPSDTSRVPVTRTINGKALSENITLAAADVGAATPAEVAAAKQEAINTVLGENVSADFDTLKEVADWIQSDTTGAAGLINRVSAIEADYLKASELTTLTTTEIEELWASA